MDLLHPKCALAWGDVTRCERCRQFKRDCQDINAYDSQMADRLRRPQSAPESVAPAPPPQTAPTPSTPPTGAVAPLPCPFCGGTNIRDTHIRDGRSLGCATCYASVIAFQPDASQHALVKWNTRTANHHAALVEALEGFVRDWSGVPAENLKRAEREGAMGLSAMNRILKARALLARVRGESGNGA